MEILQKGFISRNHNYGRVWLRNALKLVIITCPLIGLPVEAILRCEKVDDRVARLFS